MNIRYKDFNKDALNVIRKKKISSIKDLQVFVYYLLQEGFEVEKIKEKIKEYKVEYKVKDLSTDSIIDIISQNGTPENPLKNNEKSVFLYKTEIDYLKNISSDNVRKILFLLLIISKWSNHSSGWIRYNKKYLFDFWGIKCKEDDKTKIMNECCQNGLDLRVVGSKSSIVCFKVSFRDIGSEYIKELKTNEDIISTYKEVFL